MTPRKKATTITVSAGADAKKVLEEMRRRGSLKSDAERAKEKTNV